MGFAIGLLFGAAAGIVCTVLCVSGKSKNVFTNADRIALNTDRLAEALYNSDDYNDICTMTYDEQLKRYVGCKHGDDGSCRECIKEWLNMEVDTECKD